MDPSCNWEASSNAGEKTVELFDKVFGLELLRELVLDYVIHDKEEDKAISNIRSCRLVCKDWFRSISRILLKCQEPLFRLNFDRLNKHIFTFLRKFSNVVNKASGLYERVPPFSFEADTDLFFEEKNCQRLSKFLVHCASGLVELTLTFGSLNRFVVSADISLPKLRKFKAEMNYYRVNPKQADVINFATILSITKACKELKSFTVNHMIAAHPPPASFFPSSITELRLSSLKLDPEELLKDLAPTLKVLKLRNIDIPRMDGLVSSILEKVKETLQFFCIILSSKKWRLEKQTMTFRLPLMEKLENLEIFTEYLELEQNFSCLEQLVPALTHLSLHGQTVSAFRKWTYRSCFHSVSSLKTSLSSLELDDHGLNKQVTFDLCTVESMKIAFPNVRELRIKIYGRDTSVFMFIMKEMRNLQKLSVEANHYYKTAEIKVPSEFWAALLLGIPVESVAALNKSPELWEDMEYDSTASIRNMTALELLEIDCSFGHNIFEVSDSVFRHAFFLMPNLTTLVFKFRFRISKEMQQSWTDRGCVIDIG